jgi:uncharacterized protein (TIGR00661 family)
MKILYGIQGTGNGHITKAIEMVPLLKNYADVDVVISGNNYEINLPFEVKYNFKGITFLMNKNGGIDYWDTYKNLEIKKLFSDIKKIPISNYDLVITDFEPLSAWAARKNRIPVVGFGHQASFAYKETPILKNVFDPGRWVLKNFVRSHSNIGVHFKSYHPNIYTPIIRQKIKDLSPSTKNYIVVYLPAVHEDVVSEILSYIPCSHFCVFSKYAQKNKSYKNIEIFPLSESVFTEKIRDAKGVITNAGFETPAETLYLGKKLLVIPVKGQYEQQCNALALSKLGITTLKSFDFKHIEIIKHWIKQPQMNIPIEPANPMEIIKSIFKEYSSVAAKYSGGKKEIKKIIPHRA